MWLKQEYQVIWNHKLQSVDGIERKTASKAGGNDANPIDVKARVVLDEVRDFLMKH